ncbi:MAG TPA: hypothetical protein VG347_00860 [Verrucomicrobiae bacterium]|nr:hypothetical protein [Verrucomicrobiae bacterium]
MDLTLYTDIRLPKRHNTRRNRTKAFRKFFNRIDEESYHQPCAPCATENEVRCAAHLAENIERGVTLKTYSAWAGCDVRHLSRLLNHYRRQLLEGQRLLA